jgi:predicted phage terminase large subunit-like protein
VVWGLEGAIQQERVWWVAPTYAQASIAWRVLESLVGRYPFAKPRRAERYWEFWGGGEFWFKSADRPENLRGEGIDRLIMDEADFQNELVWEEVLRPALMDRMGIALFLSTPYVEDGWFHKLFKSGIPLEQRGDPLPETPLEEQAPEGTEWQYHPTPEELPEEIPYDPDVRSFQFPSWTNPYLDKAEVEKSRLRMPTITFRREIGAEFVGKVGARVKSEWIRYTQMVPVRLRISIGVDLAISEKTEADYTAIVVLGLDDDGNVYVLDAIRDRCSFHQQQEMIKNMARKWEPMVVGVEDAGYQRAAVQELERKTLLTVQGIPPRGDKVARFSPLEARYEHGLVYHLRGLPLAFKEEITAFPTGEHDDFVDAMAYAWEALATFGLEVGTSPYH